MAQDISGTSLATTAAATAREIGCELLICWGFDTKNNQWPDDWAVDGTDETDRVINLSWDRKITVDPTHTSKSPLASLTITLDNRDQRYSPYNATGALYSDLLGATYTEGVGVVLFPRLWHIPVRLRMSIGGEYITVFSGYLESPTGESYGLTGDNLKLRAMDRGAWLLERKASTTLYKDQRTDEWITFLLNDSDLGNMDITNATIDIGVMEIPYCWLDKENIYSEIQDAVASEGGWFFFDETGEAQFRNSTWWIAYDDSTSSQWTFSTSRWESVDMSHDWEIVGTGAVIEYQPRAPVGDVIIFRSDETIMVPSSGKTFDINFIYPADTDLLALATTLVAGTDYRAAAGCDDLSDSVSLELTTYYAQEATVTVTNSAGRAAFIPFLQVQCSAMLGLPNRTVRVDVSTPLVNDKERRISMNPYVQTEAQANLLASLAANRMRYPRLTYKLQNARAVPWLQLGDRITISATEPLSSSRDGIITELAFSWAPNSSFLMNITAIDTDGLFEYESYFIVGTDDYNDARMYF